MKKNLKFAETFVGCGGSHNGFKQLGFKDIFVNDNNDVFLESLKKNSHSKNLKFFNNPIEELSKLDILKIANLEKG